MAPRISRMPMVADRAVAGKSSAQGMPSTVFAWGRVAFMMPAARKARARRPETIQTAISNCWFHSVTQVNSGNLCNRW